MSKLHWSVDYAYASPLSAEKSQEIFEGEFEQILTGVLLSSPVDCNAGTKTHHCTLLPNFWGGFKNGEDPYLNIGRVSIKRSLDDGNVWWYTIEHENTSSGEELFLNFTCDNKPERPLVGSWQIRSENNADGSYSSLSLTGACNEKSDGERVVSVTTANGLSIAAGNIKDNETLTCNWALFDILPLLSEKGRLDHLAMLDDLEILKNDCRISPLEDWVIEVGNEQHILSGFCVFGRGFPPTYWWLTESGEVAVMSTMLATYVLNERSD